MRNPSKAASTIPPDLAHDTLRGQLSLLLLAPVVMGAIIWFCATRVSFLLAHTVGRAPADVAPLRQPNGQLSSELAAQYVSAALAQGSSEFDWDMVRGGARIGAQGRNPLLVPQSGCGHRPE